MGSSVKTNVNVTNTATEDVHSDIQHNIINNNNYKDTTTETHLYKENYIAGNDNVLTHIVNDGHQVFHLMNLQTTTNNHIVENTTNNITNTNNQTNIENILN